MFYTEGVRSIGYWMAMGLLFVILYTWSMSSVRQSRYTNVHREEAGATIFGDDSTKE